MSCASASTITPTASVKTVRRGDMTATFFQKDAATCRGGSPGPPVYARPAAPRLQVVPGASRASFPSVSPVLVDPRDAVRLLLPAGGKDALDVLLPFVARVLPDLVVLLSVAVDGERHLPGTREHLRVLERHRIVDAIGTRRRPAFHHV